MLRQFIQYSEKQAGSLFIDRKVYDTATLLLSSIKEVEKLIVQLRAERYEVQNWSKIINRIDKLEKRQAACAALIEEDQEVLLKVECVCV